MDAERQSRGSALEILLRGNEGTRPQDDGRRAGEVQQRGRRPARRRPTVKDQIDPVAVLFAIVLLTIFQ